MASLGFMKKDTADYIVIKGARVNNLKNIDVEIPRNKLVVITGLSGSGKSSLAFDTLYAEGQRRYVESLSSYARQFMGRMAKPEVDYILGISPAVAIEQKVKTNNPRSTVGTSTEIYEYLKLMFARIGRTFSPVSGVEVKRHSVSDVVDYVYSLPADTRVTICSPLEDKADRSLKAQCEILHQEGFMRVSIGGTIVRIEDFLPTCKEGEHYVDPLLIVDRIRTNAADDDQRARLAESVQTAFFEGRGCCRILTDDGTNSTAADFSNSFTADGIIFEKPNPNFFSFNNPYGACPTCQGYGNTVGIDEDLVVPNKSLSIYEDAVVCWKGEKMVEWKEDLIRCSAKIDFPIHTPYCDLTDRQRLLLWEGNELFPGIYGFFRWVESQSFKIQYRVMLARYKGKTVCPDCHGTRLRQDAAYVKVGGKAITELTQMPISELAEWLTHLQLTDHEQQVCRRLMVELHNRVGYLIDVGLGYLTLNRNSNTLSGGESQRINLATSLGSSLVGSMYILDEPSIGLHSRDTDRLIQVLHQLRDLGNTVIVVEHDEDIIRSADYIIDIGPGAGRLGGEVVFAGTYQQLMNSSTKTLTAEYLRGERRIELPTERLPWRDRIALRGVSCHNLHHIDVDFPLGVLTVVTGVSGSGKTTLVKQVLYDVLHHRMEGSDDYLGRCAGVSGDLRRIDCVELIDQNPIGRSSRSNPATYMKIYDEIRSIFARQPLAKMRGYHSGYFSFNVDGGRCPRCLGEGYITIGMQFMADVHLVCDECHGTRFREDILQVLFYDKNIHDILEMTVDNAIDFFTSCCAQHAAHSTEAMDYEQRSNHSRILTAINNVINRLQPLQDVGLGYLKLGQSSSSLSGGEAQRVKLASYIAIGDTVAPHLFIFDEPSTGLHFHDIQKLIAALRTLIVKGHSVIVIEHHPDIIKVADWVIDMGPEGGNAGGKVVFAGTPEQLALCPDSHTARYLKDIVHHC